MTPQQPTPRVPDHRTVGIQACDAGGWRIHSERLVYDGSPWVQVNLFDVTAPNGQQLDYQVVQLPRVAVALLVVDERALMLWRHRWPIGRSGYELLGGLVEAGETGAEAATRETLEESGWRPVGEPVLLGEVEPLPGQMSAPVEIYLWRDAELVGEPTDTEEAGRLEWVPVRDVPALMTRGHLLGAPTLIALLTYLVSIAPAGRP